MLFYSKKLQQYITKVIIPKVLLIKDRFIYTGSFGRKAPYVTDIDTYSVVYPDLTEVNIYPELVKLVKRAAADRDLILLYIRLGTDDRFRISENTLIEDAARIRLLLPPYQQLELDDIMTKYADDTTHAAYTIGRLVRDYKRIQWTPDEVVRGRKKLAGNLEITMSEALKANPFLLLRYYIMIGSVPVGLDVVVYYNETAGSPDYKQDTAAIHILQPNYENALYYVLFPIRSYFRRHDRATFRELNNIIDNKYGSYKQLMVKIGDYDELYEEGYLDPQMASSMVRSIAADTAKVLGERNAIITQLRDVTNSKDSADTKLRKWGILLHVLDDEIRLTLNSLLKPELYEYLNRMPESLRRQHYFRYDELVKMFEGK